MADWYIASGSMNLLTELETHIFIQRCFEKSRKGFVFNLLDGKKRKGDYSYWKSHDILKLCRTFSENVKLKEGLSWKVTLL